MVANTSSLSAAISTLKLVEHFYIYPEAFSWISAEFSLQLHYRCNHVKLMAQLMLGMLIWDVKRVLTKFQILYCFWLGSSFKPLPDRCTMVLSASVKWFGVFVAISASIKVWVHKQEFAKIYVFPLRIS